MKLSDFIPRADPICAICQKPITQGDFQAEDVQTIDGHAVHAGCVQQKLGELIEAHPIVSGGNRRG